MAVTAYAQDSTVEAVEAQRSPEYPPLDVNNYIGARDCASAVANVLPALGRRSTDEQRSEYYFAEAQDSAVCECVKAAEEFSQVLE